MISKVFTGHSFGGSVQYVCKDQRRATVLASEGVRGHDHKLMIEDFKLQHESRPSKTKACFHSILSFYPGENPGDAKMIEIAQKYLKELGITDTQYCITKHTDKAHIHLHIIANLVNNEGESIKDNWIGLRGKKAAQRLTEEYKLVPAVGKNLELTHMESLSESEANRYKIYKAITDLLPHCRTMYELENLLLKQGIETQYKYKGQTQEKQGISFKLGDDCFKGSQIDRKFSLGNLEKSLGLQQKYSVKQASPFEPAVLLRPRPHGSFLEQQGQHFGKQLPTIIDALLKTEDTYKAMPYELSGKKKRKKKGLSR